MLQILSDSFVVEINFCPSDLVPFILCKKEAYSCNIWTLLAHIEPSCWGTHHDVCQHLRWGVAPYFEQ